MSEKLMYQHPVVRQFCQHQLKYVPAEKKPEQLKRAQALLAEIEAEKQYPYQYICYRITGYRPEAYPNLKIDGSDLEHDLAQFIRDLTDTTIRQYCLQQLKNQSKEKQLEQLDRAEKILTEIHNKQTYSFYEICTRITGQKPESVRDFEIPGIDLKKDLTQLICDLSEMVPPVPMDQIPEPVLTLDEVSKDLKISTKTINRWRDRGLVTRKVLRRGRRRLVIRQSILDKFLSDNKDKVSRSSRFSKLTDDEKLEILREAKRMARNPDICFTEICRHVAEKVGRSVETVRYTIKKHDSKYKEFAIFPYINRPLNEDDKMTIYNSHRRGISVDTLAKRYHRTRTTVHRVINEKRAQRLLNQPIEFIYSEEFDDPEVAGTILDPMPDLEKYEASKKKALHTVPKGLPPQLASLYEVPLLTREQEAHLFRQMNYLKYQAHQLQQSINPAKARSADIDQLESLLKQANEVKNHLIRANMRLVTSIAKHHEGPHDSIWELQSDGHISLIRAVEKFDYSRGNKFSTYATWAIRKNFARSVPDSRKQRDRFMTGVEDIFDLTTDTRTNEYELLQAAEMSSKVAHRMLNVLSPRERKILELRYGINSNQPHTLEQVGKEMGITKERVRQLETRAKSHLKALANREMIELQ